MALRRFDIEAGGDAFAFKAETEPTIAFWLGKYPAARKQSAVIPLLWLAQKDNEGWLSEPAMREVADRLARVQRLGGEVGREQDVLDIHGSVLPVGVRSQRSSGPPVCMGRAS